ncbi:MAG: AAA family ATPase [Candidatus Omnitrophica bacterium]|nr:AAA family ATPase [Candidatus Omnitrophota bacterium]
MRKIALFWELHWIKAACVLVLAATILLPVAVLSKLDSYQRLYLIALLSIFPVEAIISAAAFVVFLYWLHYGGGSFSKLNKSMIRGKNINVAWSDVIGMEEAKMEAWELVELLRDHAKIKQIGGKILRGILLIGPPGCGKTYLAKAIATEAELPFLSISGSEFIEIFVGTGPARVRKIFKKARQMARVEGGCILFIDELDAVGTSRGADLGFGAQTERNNTVNELLIQMDGLESGGQNIIVIGATNAGEEVLDPALLRPGRLDRKIYVDRPGLEDREKLFAYYLGKVKADPAIDVARLARRSVWKSPADIQNLVQESALIATRNKRDLISFKDISEAFERIEMGQKRYHKTLEEERKDTAYHEAGHLIALYFLHPTDDVFKASIYMRRSSLGVVYHAPRHDYYSHKRDKLLADIKVSLAGYVAERLKCSSTTSGVSADFGNAMRTAHHMVWSLGMGSNGFVGDYEVLTGSWVFRQGSSGDHLSDRVKEKLNDETHHILQSCMKDVEVLLQREDTLLERFKDELLKKNELEYDEIEAIFTEYGKQRPDLLLPKPSPGPTS